MRRGCDGQGDAFDDPLPEDVGRGESGGSEPCLRIGITPATAADKQFGSVIRVLSPDRSGDAVLMNHSDPDVLLVDRIIEDLRSIRTRRCDPKSNENPTYLQISNAVSSLLKVKDTLSAE
jgi:hypothetical protein